MQVSVKEAARLLNISEKKIYAYIRSGELPAYRINKAYLINSTQLLEWSIGRGYTVSPELFAGLRTSDAQELPSLCDCLDVSHIFYNLPGADTASVLQSIIDKLFFVTEEEKKQLYSSLLAREMLGSTAIGNGIAIPHVRNPIILNIHKPVITLNFLREPIDFGALDSKKVGIFFMLLSTTTRVHLHLLARLSFVLQKEGVLQRLLSATPAQEVVRMLNKAEKEIPPVLQARGGA